MFRADDKFLWARRRKFLWRMTQLCHKLTHLRRRATRVSESGPSICYSCPQFATQHLPICPNFLICSSQLAGLNISCWQISLHNQVFRKTSEQTPTCQTEIISHSLFQQKMWLSIVYLTFFFCEGEDITWLVCCFNVHLHPVCIAAEWNPNVTFHFTTATINYLHIYMRCTYYICIHILSTYYSPLCKQQWYDGVKFKFDISYNNLFTQWNTENAIDNWSKGHNENTSRHGKFTECN